MNPGQENLLFFITVLLYIKRYLGPIRNVTGSRLLSYQKNTWLRTMCCLQIIWQENRKSQWRSWSDAIPCGEDVVQAGCD